MLFGGNNPLTGVLYTGDTWEWNGANWANRIPIVHPPARKNAAMAYDSDRGVCVLFGGGTNIFQIEIPFNDTWEWNGAVWTMRSSNDPSAGNRPPPMDGPIMAYDSFRKRTVLLGSNERTGGEFNPVTRTWEWDGNVWTVHDRSTTASPAPPPRIDAAMAYDSARRVTVVFGGAAYEGGLLNDTWTWDGTMWRLVANGGTDTRDQHAMAFDDRRKVLVLFSGVHGEPFVDTSEWDGSSWTRRPFAQFNINLPPRRLHMMWYDTGDQKVVVFGGITGSPYNILDDLWEARPPGRWVDFNYLGAPSLPETGEFYEPFDTLREAVDAAPPGCTLILKTGSRAETLTISKPLTLEAYNGPVTIGKVLP